MYTEAQECYLAVSSGDARFDGMFYVAVTSTRIYCRPSCTARTPKRENCRFYPSAAAAQLGGFRACKRCRPDTVPGSPEWQTRSDTAARAMRLIADGVVDRDGVGGLASAVGYSERQLNRVLHEALGAGALALARSQRAQTARILIETTMMSFATVAFAAGFNSIRQFNDTIKEVYATTPTELRARSKVIPAAPGIVALRLAFRKPFALDRHLAFLGTRALVGIEHVDVERNYTRSLPTPHGDAIARVFSEPDGSVLRVAMRMEDVRDLAPAVARLRRLFDLDADPVEIDRVLQIDPLLRSVVSSTPGLRVPGCVDATEMAVRAIVGQQVSVAGARTIVGRIVARLGRDLAMSDEFVTRAFPSAATIAQADLDGIGMPTARIATVQRVCEAIAGNDLRLDDRDDRANSRERLLAIRGIGPWTADYLLMRALGDPDAFLATDLGVKHGAVKLGIRGELLQHAQRWRPWRSYALMHLWNALS